MSETSGPADAASAPHSDPADVPHRPVEAASGTDVPTAGLDDVDLAVLALERRGWPGSGAKERAVREELGLSPTRYYQLLNALLDDPAALAHDPVTVNRLRRRRAALRTRR